MKIQLITVRQLARMYHYSVQTIRSMIRSGLIPARRFGRGRYRIDVQQIANLIPEISAKK